MLVKRCGPTVIGRSIIEDEHRELRYLQRAYGAHFNPQKKRLGQNIGRNGKLFLMLEGVGQVRPPLGYLE